MCYNDDDPFTIQRNTQKDEQRRKFLGDEIGVQIEEKELAPLMNLRLNFITGKKLAAYCVSVLLLQGTMISPQVFAESKANVSGIPVITNIAGENVDDDAGKFRHYSQHNNEFVLCMAVSDEEETSLTEDPTEPEDETETTENPEETSDTMTVDSSGDIPEETTETTEPKAVSMDMLTHNLRYMENYFMIDGIDVSKYQQTVDWEAVAAEGVKFAIIRLGYRGYGTAGNMKIDDYFEVNLEGAKAAGLDVGVYFFTQAITEEEAIEEANFVLDALDGAELDLPVYFDIESVTYDIGRLDTADLTPEQHTRHCELFCETIIDAGYEAGIYANTYWLTNELDADYLEAKYPIWFANYRSETPYQGEYHIWQYTSEAQIAGVPGYVDRNVMYSRMAEYAQETYTIENVRKVTPEIYGDGKLTFTSSDPTVASVDENGAVTPLKNGETTITAVSDNGSSDSIDIVVTAFPDFTLSSAMIHIDALGGIARLFTIGAEESVTWTSGDTSIVKVTKDGILVAVGYGTTTITAMTADGEMVSCTVFVTKSNLQSGDCNMDGRIDATDAASVLIFSASLGTSSTSSVPESLLHIYDLNSDGLIDALDASTILSLSANSGTGASVK